jgi:hypothetical protein
MGIKVKGWNRIRHQNQNSGALKAQKWSHKGLGHSRLGVMAQTGALEGLNASARSRMASL